MHSLFGDLGILVCALLWGTSYSVTKYVIAEVSPLWFITLRFGLAAILLLIFFHKRFFSLSKDAYIGGLLAGATITFTYIFNAVGLQYTTAGNQAFITSTFVVMTPLVHWAIWRKFPGFRVISAALVSFTGLCLLTIEPGFKFNLGDMLGLGSAFGASLHMVILELYNKKHDPVGFTVAQVVFSLIPIAAVAFIFSPMPGRISVRATSAIVYMAVGVTMAPLLIQNVAQKFTTASRTAVIMATEGVFGVLFGCLLLGEVVTLKMFVACSLIFSGIILVELNPMLARAAEKRKEERGI